MCIMCTCKAVQFFQLVNHKIENLSFFTIEYMIATENYPFLELSRHKNNTPYVPFTFNFPVCTGYANVAVMRIFMLAFSNRGST